MKTLEYVGPHDEIEIDGFGTVARGKPFEVADDDLAGRAPHGHRADDDFDPGAGLLAQVENFREYVKPARRTAAAEQPPRKRVPRKAPAKKAPAKKAPAKATAPSQPPADPSDNDDTDGDSADDTKES